CSAAPGRARARGQRPRVGRSRWTTRPWGTGRPVP
ncbi:MAG: hypothetical protein AVDCRST_MAG11-2227, partial [uncultured Gemmatimonadaceae bacterium]